MQSSTPALDVDIEYNSINGYGEWSARKGKISKYNISEIDFGIVKNAEISLGLDNNILNIKVTNTQGNIIMEGNPYTKNIPNVSDLDERLEQQRLEKGSSFVRIEIDNQQMYGAKLEITYGITVINNSDLNFYENKDAENYGYYYKFGEKTNEASITLNEVNNYLDSKLVVAEQSKEVLKNYNDYKTNQRKILDGNDPYDVNVVKINQDKFSKIYTQKNKSTLNKNYKTSVQFVASKTLSEDKNDFYYVNQSEVIDMEVTDEPALIEDLNEYSVSEEYPIDNNTKYDVKYTNYFDYEVEGVKFENPSRVATLTIIPPTGFDTNKIILYSVIIIISGIILSIGIITIKKKII